MTYCSAVATLTGTNAVRDGLESDDWFNPVEHLGKRGTRLLPRGVQLTAACASLLPPAGLGSVPSNRRGIWVATNTFAEQMHETMDKTVRAHGSDGLSPAQAPYFSVNLVASRLSRDVQSHGMSTTLTTPGTGLADALAAARLALRAGRVDRAVVACTDVEHATADGLAVEGCVSFLLERDCAPGAVQISVERGFAAPESGTQSVSRVPNRGRECRREYQELLIFTDIPLSDPSLHAVLDLEGECVDAHVHPLGLNQVAQGLELARLIDLRRTATVLVVCSSGQWARISLAVAGGTAT